MNIGNALKRPDFSFLNQSDFKKKYVSGHNASQIHFYVGGIRCGKCVRKLEDLAILVPGLKRLRVEMAQSLAYAEIDLEVLSLASLAEKIADLGFYPIPLSHELTASDAQRLEDRKDLTRIGVAGVCAANIMMFSFATYFGETGEFYALLSWLSLTLYIPVLTYVAWPFYIGAWASLRKKQLSIDLPVAVASIIGFVFSVVEMFRGQHDIYFDSLSGFLFLILVSRWIQKRFQRHFLRAEEIEESFNLSRARKVDSTGWKWVPSHELKTGDQILLFKDETLPAEGILSDSARFNLAWISGESKSQLFLENSSVPAGSKLCSNEAKLTVRTNLNDTTFGKIIHEVHRFALTSNRTISEADRWAQWLVGIVFTFATIFLVLYWPVSHDEAIRRSLALIILACPCAMAFGTPLALAFALRKSQRSGLIVKDANAFDEVKSLQTIFFDKTGTLTEIDLKLCEDPDSIPHVYKKIILSLENNSSHPIAFAFRKSFSPTSPLISVDSLREIHGVGVSGYIYGQHYELRCSHLSVSKISCTLFEEKTPKFNFTFEADVRADSIMVLSELRKRGYRVALLSGDKKESVSAIALELGFSEEDTFSDLSPEQKRQVVSRAEGSMMVGDGINDSLALMQASIGMASSGGVEVALKSADVVLGESGVMGVLRFLDISRETAQLIRRNLTISVFYNLCGGVLALSGYVNPFVAALLMPTSSGFILLHTWWSSRK